MERWGHYWSFTTRSIQQLFEEVFTPAHVKVAAQGNVLVAMSFLYGLGSQELRQTELDYRDRDYAVVITVRAEKPNTHS
jgi:hypothetical protein